MICGSSVWLGSIARRVLPLVALALLLACSGGTSEGAKQTSPSKAEPAEPLEIEAPEPAREPEAERPEPPKPERQPEPFDPLAATEATVRITAVHDKHWAPCGIIHSVGAIEVEVLRHGEPPPKLVLYVSCPVDVGREMLVEGNILRVTLHARKQSWPKPKVELPQGVPVRYVASLAIAIPPSLE